MWQNNQDKSQNILTTWRERGERGEREREHLRYKAYYTALCQHLFLLTFIFPFSLFLLQLLIMLEVNLIKYKVQWYSVLQGSAEVKIKPPETNTHMDTSLTCKYPYTDIFSPLL